jgi:hypothetical protein
MRYLYGDSTPFPLGFNFLLTLEAFMTAATRVVQLEHESQALTRQVEDAGQGRVRGLEALEQFHNVVMKAVQDTAQRVQHAHALEYARTMADFAGRYVEEHRRTVQSAADRELAGCRTENERRVIEQRALVETFLKTAKLPVVGARVTMNMTVEGKEGRNAFSAVFQNPDGIVSSFTLGTGKSAAWAHARRVADLATGVSLNVGVKKSWLRGTVTSEEVALDEYIVSRFEFADDSLEMTVRRRLQEKDTLLFRLRRGDAGVYGTVEHVGETEAEALDGALSPQDLSHLGRVWSALKSQSLELLDTKEQLLGAQIDGNDVFADGQILELVKRLVAMFAPTVQEVAKRSPNEFELSLKMESDEGRREELYLRKDQLTTRLQPLPLAGREIFAPLGLDSWVPGVTHAPPPVSSDRGSGRL